METDSRSVRWSRRLSQVAVLLLVVQFVLVMAAVALPSDWHMPLLLTAMVCIVAACILGLTTVWIDYRSGADHAGPRDLLEVMIVGLLIVGPAIYLEKNHGFSWWLSAACIALIVMPPWLLYLRALRRKADRITS